MPALSMRACTIFFLLIAALHGQLALSADAALQDCTPPLLGRLAEFAQASGTTESANLHLIGSACKVWPKDNNITLAALAYAATPENKLLVVMWDNRNERGIAAYAGRLTVRTGCDFAHPLLAIDSARYDVKPGVRAFGVDIANGQGLLCSDAGLVKTGQIKTGLVKLRNLYVLERNVLKPVVEDFDLVIRRDVAEAVAMNSSQAAEEKKQAVQITLKIALEKTASHGYADLSVFSVSTASACAAEPFQHELKYDGTRYPLQELKQEYSEWLQAYCQ